MELKSSGTFSMASGRPIDTVRFTSVSHSRLEYDREEPGEHAEHVVAKINDYELSPKFFEALNNLIPIVVDALDLGKTWLQGEILGIKTQWTWSGDKWLLKINEIELSRSTFNGEIPMQRSVKTGKITEEGFDPFTRSMLENIWDEAWIHLKQQPKQGDLFETQPSAKSISLENRRSAVRAELEQMAIPSEGIKAYLEFAGETPSVDDFNDWNEGEYDEPVDLSDRKRNLVGTELLVLDIAGDQISEYLEADTESPSVERFYQWQADSNKNPLYQWEPKPEEPITPPKATPRRTRSKAKKEAVPA